ncbi:MAG: hypothetical protein HYS27_12370 [Deltaproteobacteria bacterium]|nr:hypothetical protein [Deltaproteobacteria bacterium]
MLAIALALLAQAPAIPTEEPMSLLDPLAELDADFALLQREVAALAWPEPGIEASKRILSRMFDVDQRMRKLPSSSEPGERFGRVDAFTRETFARLIGKTGWITLSRYGEEAAQAAWLIVQHADLDVAFQRDVLARMEKLLATGEVKRDNYAYLWDRVAVNEGRKQRFGTQGRCTGPGRWEPREIEDPARVDALREQFDIARGNGTLAQYTARMNELCRR